MTHPEPFYAASVLRASSWQALERTVARLLTLQGFEYSWTVGQSGDGGADVIATRPNQSGGEDIRWLIQVKKYSNPVGEEVVDETLRALQRYGARVPVIVSTKGFTSGVLKRREKLGREAQLYLQLWGAEDIEAIGRRLSKEAPIFQGGGSLTLRRYQSEAIERIIDRFADRDSRSALVVLATGLGKTVTAAEAVRRIRKTSSRPLRVLVLAHTVELVQQLERSFWPFMSSDDATCVVGGGDRPQSYDDLTRFSYVFGVKDAIYEAQKRDLFPNDIFDLVIVDECHHLGAATYEAVLDYLQVGQPSGPFLLGLTATPWRPGGEDLRHRFDDPVVQVDLPTGLRDGFLANVDYRMFTDNVDWDQLRVVKGDRFTPEKINRTLFITNWTDSIIERTRETWAELPKDSRGIVFCGTIDHAEKVAQKINALGFTRAVAISSKNTQGQRLTPIERARILWDFASGKIGILCAVDVLNEGIDVPDVNLVVFQRVTHSRRIFVQQLGRGLRLKKGKDRVVVLDFVTDIRRFAEGLALDRALDQDGPRPGDVRTITLPNKVTFMRATEEDFDAKEFLTHWLRDIDAVAAAGEDVSILSFPDLRSIPASRSAMTSTERLDG